MSSITILNPFGDKTQPYFYVAGVISYVIGFILYTIYIATKGERAWQIATFVSFAVSIVPYFVFWYKNDSLNFKIEPERSMWSSTIPEGSMTFLGLLTLGFAIYNWARNGNKIENMKQNLPHRYWQAEALFSLFLFLQVLITGYYFFIKKIFTENKNLSPLLWLGIITCCFLLANAATGEIWNITTNFITAG